MRKEERITDLDESERIDRNGNGLDDSIEPTVTNIEAGSAKLAERLRQNTSTDPRLSGGDVDAQWDMAESGGDEAASGSMPTPGQNVVSEIGEAIGVTYQDNEELKFGEKERARDKHRWELDPASSEDYRERNREQK
jgi:hypothetical protein